MENNEPTITRITKIVLPYVVLTFNTEDEDKIVNLLLKQEAKNQQYIPYQYNELKSNQSKGIIKNGDSNIIG